MVTVTPKTIADMRMSGTCPTHARTDISVRDIKFTIDEPSDRGGTNQGPTPTETLVGALVGCTNVILSRIAEKAHVPMKDLKVDAHAKFDRRGVMLQEDVKVPFPEIKLTVSFASPAPDAQVQQLRTDLAKFCPISKVIRESGTKIEEVWNVTRG